MEAKSRILIEGKNIDHVNSEHFKEIILKVVDYFNTIYDKMENGQIWF